MCDLLMDIVLFFQIFCEDIKNYMPIYVIFRVFID